MLRRAWAFGFLQWVFPSSLVILRSSTARLADARVKTDLVHRGDLGVVQVEGRTLRADPRQLVEVVARRRAGGRPLQRHAVTPRVIHADLLRVLPRLVHVLQERQGGD